MDREQLPKEITREQLYEKVWQTPMWRLCKEFGLSDRGMGKFCTRWNVPVPPKGHWRRLETGGKTSRIPLPPEPGPVSIRIFPSPKRSTPKSLPTVHVPERLTSPDELVRRTRENWSTNKPFEPSSLDLRVSKGTRARAIRIADAVIKELKRRGHSVVVDGHRKTYAVIGEEKVGFYVEERSTRHETVLTDDEKKRHVYKPRYEFEPSGRLSLRIDGYSRDIRHGWSDGARQKVEGVVAEFLDGLERTAEEARLRRLERLEDDRRRAEERRLREEEERKVKELSDHLTLWRTMSDLREYLAFAESFGVAEGGGWIKWVRGRLAACEGLLEERITKSGAA